MSKYKSILFYIDGVKSKEQMIETYLDYMRGCQGFDEELAVAPKDEVVHAVCLIQALREVELSEMTEHLKNKYDDIRMAEAIVLEHIATAKSFDPSLFASRPKPVDNTNPFDNEGNVIPIHEEDGEKFVTLEVQLKLNIVLRTDEMDSIVDYNEVDIMDETELRGLISDRFDEFDRTNLGEEVLNQINFERFI